MKYNQIILDSMNANIELLKTQTELFNCEPEPEKRSPLMAMTVEKLREDALVVAEQSCNEQTQ